MDTAQAFQLMLICIQVFYAFLFMYVSCTIMYIYAYVNYIYIFFLILNYFVTLPYKEIHTELYLYTLLEF